MSHEVFINKEKFKVNTNEYTKVNHDQYSNLNILDQLGFHERQISLLKEISNLYPNKVNIKMNNVSHGGFIPIKCSTFFDKIYINNNNLHYQNILENIVNHLKNKNIYYTSYIEDSRDLYEINFDNQESSIIISLNNNHPYESFNKYNKYELTNLSTKWTPQPTLYIYVSKIMNDSFQQRFKTYFKEDSKLDYDNLIHLCIMVKNGGPQFEDMLNKNMNIIDRWTILDTGSTDDTIKIINDTLIGNKEGELYQEPFINFRDSRNRCIDLAGKDCKFIIMLDDTYVIDGELRDFLNIVRGDQISTSFTLIIVSDDTQYGSNRIIKSDSGLRYVHKIHEVITDKNNLNIVIPIEKAKILDGRFQYMEERTMKRKELDLKLLYEEVEEDPTNPRTYYYLAQTYNLLGQYDKSYYYFLKRAEFKNAGFIQERIDAIFEAARTANFKLNKPWEEFMSLYEQAYKTDESRPDAIYFMGINHYLKNEHKKAYEFFKKGFEIGYPIHCQYSLKPTLSYHFLPKFLTRLCYTFEDYQLGENASLLFLQNNSENSENYEEIKSYYMIFKKLNEYKNQKSSISKCSYDKPLFVFVADGGFNQWSGSNILTTGVGGSETYIIEMARYIQKNGLFQVIVFCNCEREENFEGVEYKHLSIFPKFVNENYIKHCMISRFTEYLPLAFKGYAENVYLVLHDLGPSGNVIPSHSKLKKIFCLTEWHVKYFTEQFKELSNITVPFYYGIDFSKFKTDTFIEKQPFKFIYSSFPNRGLLPLLKMWPKIYAMNSQASLHIYTDVNGKWVNNVAPEHMKEVRHFLNLYSNLNIHYYGWVDKKTLANAWLSSDIWFYPCIFMETFCLTALEAALTKTLVFTNDLAALQNTVGDRGIVIPGNPLNQEWQDRALEKIRLYFSSFSLNDTRSILYNNYRQKNYNWAKNLSWENQANKLLNEHILPNNLEYKNMTGWYNENIKDTQLFNMMINYFNISYANQKQSVKVLEVGTHTGISLINIIKQIPNSIGYGIDEWTQNLNYEIEQSFINNVNSSNLSNRIFPLKGNSSDVLTDILLKNEKIDFIYLDGSTLPHVVYTDCHISSNLLNKGGMMVINNYLLNTEDDSVPLLNIKGKNHKNSPHDAILDFIKKHKSEYKILHTSGRVFLQKL
jgi:predicted O-methyltransferase YrrM